MNRLPTLTVIIPAHNESKRIHKCLDALMRQAIMPDEIIVVDNNSTDDTAAIAAQYDRVQVIHEPRKGISYARTAGFDAASSEIIARLDADTVAAPTWAEAMLDYFTEHPTIAAITGGAALADFSPGNRYWMKSWVRVFRHWQSRLGGVTQRLYGHNFALRREVWQAVRPLLSLGDDNVSEDLDLSLAVTYLHYEVAFVPTMLTKYYFLHSLEYKKLRRYHTTDQLTHKKWRKQYPK